MNIPFGLSPTRLYVYAGVALAFLALYAFARYEGHEAVTARAERDAALDQRDTAIDANKSQQMTIDTQSKALNAWLMLGDSPAKVRQLISDALQIANKSNAALVEFRATMEKDRANPECGAALAVNLQRACPAIAGGLRHAAEAHHEADPGRNSGSGGEAAADGAHGGLRAALPLPGQ